MWFTHLLAGSVEWAEREIGILFPDFDLQDWYLKDESFFQSGQVTFCTEEQIHKVTKRNG